VSYNRATSSDGNTTVSRATGSTAPTSSSRPQARNVTQTRANTPPPSVSSSSSARGRAQKAADRDGQKMATGGRAKGGLMKKPTK